MSRITKTIPMPVELQKCDRCGVEQTAPGAPRVINLSATLNDSVTGDDLCVPCAQAVKAFVQAGVP